MNPIQAFALRLAVHEQARAPTPPRKTFDEVLAEARRLTVEMTELRAREVAIGAERNALLREARELGATLKQIAEGAALSLGYVKAMHLTDDPG